MSGRPTINETRRGYPAAQCSDRSEDEQRANHDRRNVEFFMVVDGTRYSLRLPLADAGLQRLQGSDKPIEVSFVSVERNRIDVQWNAWRLLIPNEWWEQEWDQLGLTRAFEGAAAIRAIAFLHAQPKAKRRGQRGRSKKHGSKRDQLVNHAFALWKFDGMKRSAAIAQAIKDHPELIPSDWDDPTENLQRNLSRVFPDT